MYFFTDDHKISGDFVSAACWIQGVYVYKELRHEMSQVAYFGIAQDMDTDGVYVIDKGGRKNIFSLGCTKTLEIHLQNVF